ncbi:Peptidyl-prolyl cis-trans isomerase FKBP43 [Raphanus sativus]|uniref:peptidylprolyl isomerase n=1 Tax=Raphanus sativus TaxID=3726 RepID=A0A6J0N9U0_RAPSA|nr:peptidyl-prolyl cis-trans isomerase FKBP43 [Raphanus sativus]KAJ4902630.1 Peptidyl-prolyl cis-trans isomerase FKBP43 [Raphanus sativus]
MAFWGVEVKPGKPFTLKSSTTNDAKRLHLSQATLGLTSTGTNRSILQCNVGNKSPLFLCVLFPEKVDSCQLNIEFQESEDVIFSVIGPRSVHLTGYFLGRTSAAGLSLNDDESESFGEDIVDTDVEKGSSDDYDYSDSFINDDDDRPSSTDDDELTVKERVAKTKAKKRSKRLRKKFQVSDSDSDAKEEDSVEILDSDDDHKTPKVLSSEVPLPSRVTRSKARSSTLENGEKTSEATTTHTHKSKDKKEDKPSGDVDELSKKKKKKKEKKRNKEPVVINTDEEEEKDIPETLKKPETDKAIESSTDVTLSKKKRKKERREETRERKKQATEKNMEKEASTKKLPESKLSPNEVTVEEIEKGKSDGKVAVQGKKVSILFTGKLKDTGKVFESNLEESPLRFRLGGEEVIKGLSNGVEGMRVGDKRRLIIPPSLGYSKEGLKKKDVPKNSWLVYEVEAVKVR